MDIIPMKEKVSFTIDKDLVSWFRLYCKDERTTMSSLLNQYIFGLKKNNAHYGGKPKLKVNER